MHYYTGTFYRYNFFTDAYPASKGSIVTYSETPYSRTDQTAELVTTSRRDVNPATIGKY